MKKPTFPVVPKKFTDQLVKDGWHVMQETPSIPLTEEEQRKIYSPTKDEKDEIILDLIEHLIEQGIDEDAHYRSCNSDQLEVSDIRELLSDIDRLDSLMHNLREVVIEKLNQVASCYERNKT